MRSRGDPTDLIGEPVRQRALRTGTAVGAGGDRVWPYWLERQTDPSSPAFVAPGRPLGLTNVTARNWTTIGTVGSLRVATVDPRGLVTPWPGGWSLDWWVGADDRWHLPSREAAVRQRLIDDAPVVETAMRVPGGDVLHRAFAVQAGPGGGGEALVVVEVENATSVPVAVAFAVRPYDPEGVTVVGRIGCSGGTVMVDGRVALVFPRAPARMAGSTFGDGDSATLVTSGQAGTALPPDLRDPAGLASAAFVVPVPHTAVARVVLPLAPSPPTRRPALVRRRPARAPAFPAAVPTAAAVARGWRAHAGRGMRIVLPDDRLAACVEAQRRFLLLLHDTDGVGDAPFVLGALDRYGYAAEVAEALHRAVARQRPNGSFPGTDADGAILFALGEHWRLHRDAALRDTLVPAVAKAAERIERRRHRRGERPFRDSFWAVRGQCDAGELLRAAGEDSGAAAADGYSRAFLAEVEAALDRTAQRFGTAAVPAGPGDEIDGGVAGSLVACFPLRLYGPGHPPMAATADLVRDRFVVDGAVLHSRGGLGTAGTLQLALVELEAGDPRALDRLAWLLDVATPTWTWPEAVHPRLPGGCFGDGHHPRAAADLLTLVRNLLVRETGDGLALCTLLPEGWRGAGIEVHDAPTHAGRLSFAVRWHGARPALLWELESHAGAGPVRLTAPGLDPSWSSSDLSGDALLASPAAVRGADVAAAGGSFS